jgi:hypothetical protein
MMLSIDNLFSTPLPRFNKRTFVKKEVDGTLVNYQYNQFGYRSYEPESLKESFILALGCSHTEGVGQQENETWTYKLSNLIDTPVANFGVSSCGADFIEYISYKWIQHYSLPSTVIIQWPNPIRAINWNKHQGYFTNIHSQDKIFKEKIMSGELNFYIPWIKSINLINQFWNSASVSVLNCYFDNFPTEFSQYVTPKIHSNDSENNLPWLFDSQAHDRSHHSDWCTTQWANRIKELLTTKNFAV